ncbi:MAG: asparagine synthase (glutamine-hydrolyzing) [Flavobacteriaceae bacterium]|nr:asparagine synthase (glutamine-hydrolyzing) [Flavobacteriaceae bacterium]|tara:strand:- start:2262 stop:4208 length:1947 start_codon:yes stop_codon:yes gene_type:complete
MCGIVGHWSNRKQISPIIFERMTDSLIHRGPDSSGIWSCPMSNITLGHRRLSVLDLSETGAQPMISKSKRFVIVFNGEIYNHLELRSKRLSSSQWNGSSDTETLLEMVEVYGFSEAIKNIRGMFSVAVWDRKERRLLLARDRVGEKPLYIYFRNEEIIFASELKAIYLSPSFSPELNDDAVSEFLHFGFLASGDSIHKNVTKLMPGEIAVFSSPSQPPEINKYWTLEPQGRKDELISLENEPVEEFESLLTESIKEQMLSDVPIGAFLSGGIDSSLIVGIMQKISSTPVNTFTLGYESDQTDETTHAREIADIYGTNHSEYILTPKDIVASIPGLNRAYDEPFADPSQVPTLLLCEQMRKRVTVVLSGDGGDELFGGYNRHRAMNSFFGIYEKNNAYFLRKSLASVIRGLPSSGIDLLPRILKLIGKGPITKDLSEKIGYLCSMLESRSPEEAYISILSRWSSCDEPPLKGRRAFAIPKVDSRWDFTPLNKLLYWDFKTYLPEDILVKVDRASMQHSLEVRVPFLNHRIVDFAFRLSDREKMNKGKTKALLRKLLARHLDPNVFERPKEGFSFPIGDWLRGPLQEWAEDLFQSQKFRNVHFIQHDQLDKIWKQHQKGTVNHQKGLWTILMFASWHSEYFSKISTNEHA